MRLCEDLLEAIVLTNKEFINVAGILTAVWEINFDDITLKVWYEMLKDLDYKEVYFSVEKLAATLTNRITPAHIRKACAELEAERKSTADMFIIVNNAIAKYGRYRVLEALEYIKKQDEITYMIIKALGFLNVCDNKTNFLKKQLDGLYKEVMTNVENQSVLPDKLKIELAKLKNQFEENALYLKAGEEYD